MDDSELQKFVDYLYKTPFGGILHLRNGAAIILRGNDAEILSSLEEYHVKYKDDPFTWNEIVNEQDKRAFYAANAVALTKIKWIDVEAVLEAARKLEAAEKRKSLMGLIVGRDGLLNFIASLPYAIFLIWGIGLGLKRYFGVELSHLQIGAIGGVTGGLVSRWVFSIPGRVAVVMAVLGYLLIAVVLWMLG